MSSGKRYKFKFHYDSKKALEERLLSLSYFHRKTTEEVYKYSCKYENNIASIKIEDDGLLVDNFAGKGWVFFNLEDMILHHYDELRVFNLTNNIPYVFEKFALTQEWVELGVISNKELDEEDATNSTCRWGLNKIHLKYLTRWLKDKKHLDSMEFDFIFPYLQQITFLIRTMPLTNKQLEKLEALQDENKEIKNALLHRKILYKKLTQKLVDEVLENNEIDTIKALINQTNKEEVLEYILKENHLKLDRVDNIIRKKLGIKKVYLQKEKKLKEKTNPFYARVHILTATESSKSLIIRRAPSKKMCIILWDREKNSFVAGDCTMKIEERLADISPDGNYFYYFGMTKKGEWSAITHTDSLRNMVYYRESGFRCRDVPSSHPPYVYELYKYFMEMRPYGDKNLNNGFPRFKTIERKFKKEDWDICNITPVYYRRLMRDGWSIVHHEGEHEDKYACSYATHFEKALVGSWVIKKIAYDVHPEPEGKNGGHWDGHQLIEKSSDKVYDFPDWDWAEKDEEYLYWTQKGLLYRMSLMPLVSSSPNNIEERAELLCNLNTFKVGFENRKFSLDGDVHVLRGLRLEESIPNYDTVEYHYLNSIKNGGVDACFYLGQVYLNEKKSLEKALIYSEKGFKRATQKEQLTHWHHEYYGHILFKNEYYTKAYKIFESSLNYTNEDKNRAVSYNYLGVLCKLESEYGKAIKFFEKAVSLDDSVEFYKENLNVSLASKEKYNNE